MVVLKFLKIPILMVLLSTFFSSSIFSMDGIEEGHQLSSHLGAFVQKVKKLEDVVIELKKDQNALLRIVEAHKDFLEFIFAANRNVKDLELTQAEYRCKTDKITPADLLQIQQALSAPVIIPSIPTDLDAVVGQTSPGVPAASTSAGVTLLAGYAKADLAPDPVNSTPHRRMATATIPASTIRINAGGEIADLDAKMRKILLKDAADDDDEKIVRKLLEASEAKDEDE